MEDMRKKSEVTLDDDRSPTCGAYADEKNIRISCAAKSSLLVSKFGIEGLLLGFWYA